MRTNKRSLYLFFACTLTSALLMIWLWPQSEISMILMFVLALLQFIYAGWYYGRALGGAIWGVLALSFIALVFKMTSGAYLYSDHRFFADGLVYLLAGYWLLKRKKYPLSFEAVFFLLFAAPVIIYTVMLFAGDVIFRPLSLTFYPALVFLYIAARAKRAAWALVAGTLVTALLAYIGYPNYWQSLNGTRMLQADRRATLKMTDEKGDSLNVASFGNKVVVLDVWYSGCGVCFKKFPLLETLSGRYQDNKDVAVAALNIPLANELADHKAFDLVRQYRFKALKATSAIEANDWQIDSYPAILVFDRQHRLRYLGRMALERNVVVNNAYDIIDGLLLGRMALERNVVVNNAYDIIDGLLKE